MMLRILCCCVAILLTTISGLAAPITAVAYRADGQILAVGTRGSVSLLDNATGDLIATIPSPAPQVTALAFSSTNTLAMACGEAGKSGSILLFDLTTKSATPKLIATLPAHKDLIYSLAFSPNGQTLASGSYDRVIKLWAISAKPNATPSQTLTDHSDAVYSVAFHPNGKLLASGSADRAVKVWDVATGKRLYTLSDCTDWVYAVAWHPKGTQLAAGGVDRSVRVWDVNADGGKLVSSAFAHEKAVSRIVYSLTGDTLYTVGEDRIVKAWNAKALTESLVFPTQPDAVLSTALRHDGLQLAIGRFDGRVQMLDTKTGKATATPFPVPPKPATVTTVSPDAVVKGHTTRVTLTGTHLQNAKAVHSAAAAIKFQIVKAEATQLTLDVMTTADAVPGPITLTIATDAGESKPVRLFLDRFPMIKEAGLTDSARDGMKVPYPSTIVGTLDRNGDVDYFRFDATAGQQVGVQVQSLLERAKFDPVVMLTDRDGHVLATGAGGMLGYTCETAGTYAIAVHDRDYRGGADFAYRMHIGPIPVMTGFFPLGVVRGKETPVTISGVNLQAFERAAFNLSPNGDVAPGTKQPISIKRTGGDPIGNADVLVSEFPAINMPASGTTQVPQLPYTVDGILAKPHQAHIVRFRAKQGQRLIIETNANRLGSPVDSFLELLDASGQPLPRVVLRSTAKCYTTFRDVDSVVSGIRLESWNELAIDDYLYVGTELMRIKALPKGPDDDCQFYAIEGRRVGYADTTPTHHANGSVAYKVEQHPPGTKFLSNGMPVFPIDYCNDDGGPGYGKDSRILFDPPTDGEYQVRITDASGAGGSTYAYRLTIRTPKPDFTISISSPSASVWKNGAVPITINAKRTDEFDGPITVRWEGLPAPFTAPNTVIEAGQLSATVSLSVGSAAVSKNPSPWKVTAHASINGQPVVREATGGTLSIADSPELTTTTNLNEVVIRPGQESRMIVKIERKNGLTARVPVEVRGLPHGVRVLNIGLNGILITPDRTEREVVIYAEPWVKPAEVPFVVLSRSERKGTEHAAPSVLLKVQQ